MLDRIRYTYVPAIKDKAFFADLQGRLYDVLSSVADLPLKSSAHEFQKQLGEQLKGLLDTLKDTLGNESSMRLPENLREIFESLEISSGGIPLSRRGDGIKIRHIPMILSFIARKQDEILKRGGVRYTYIWGLEEPENNVEMSSAFAMASELVDLISAGDRTQLFLITHSPIFYRIDQQRPDIACWISTHFVSKINNFTMVETKSPDDVDQSMGLMPIVAPYVTEAKKVYDALAEELKSTKILLEQRIPTVFLEGESDRLVMLEAWNIFSGSGGSVHFCAGGTAYGGANALTSRSLAWLLNVKHRPVDERMKAVALFDDDSGRIAKGTLVNESLG